MLEDRVWGMSTSPLDLDRDWLWRFSMEEKAL